MQPTSLLEMTSPSEFGACKLSPEEVGHTIHASKINYINL